MLDKEPRRIEFVPRSGIECATQPRPGGARWLGHDRSPTGAGAAVSAGGSGYALCPLVCRRYLLVASAWSRRWVKTLTSPCSSNSVSTWRRVAVLRGASAKFLNSQFSGVPGRSDPSWASRPVFESPWFPTSYFQRSMCTLAPFRPSSNSSGLNSFVIAGATRRSRLTYSNISWRPSLADLARTPPCSTCSLYERDGYGILYG